MNRQSSEQIIDRSRLRARLSEYLPDYMVPSAIVVMDRIPLNANGKVDRKALPAPEMTGSAYEAPQGEVEETLAQIWQEVLGVERVGRHDNFFELGGHSLLALKLLEKLRTHGWSAPVRTLFQRPQLSAFAQSIESTNRALTFIVPPNRIPAGCNAIQPEMVTLIELTAEEIRNIESSVPGGAANIQDIYPLAPLQEGILFHHLLDNQNRTLMSLPIP
ncbi:MAG: phosphopantetheine-binding protein [Cellvibrionaceae bacterium]|nr:phosphopantetheine-binding protein [Cellvibrionaceae bacterium]